MRGLKVVLFILWLLWMRRLLYSCRPASLEADEGAAAIERCASWTNTSTYHQEFTMAFEAGQRVRLRYTSSEWGAENAKGYVLGVTKEGYTVQFDNGDVVSGFLDHELVLIDEPRSTKSGGIVQ
jgi:exoribonuclease R